MKKNDNLKALKDFGFTDEQILELEGISTEFETRGLYSKIEKRNAEVLDIKISPSLINYDNISQRMTYDKGTKPSDIIAEYKTDIALYGEGTTTNIEFYFNNLADEFNYYGIFTTPTVLSNAYKNQEDWAELMDILAFFRKYRDVILDGSFQNDSMLHDNIQRANDILLKYYDIDLETGEITTPNNEEE